MQSHVFFSLTCTFIKLGVCIVPQETVRGAPPPDKKLLEYHFVFACVWAFGGCMLVDKVYDYRCTLRSAVFIARFLGHK